MVWAHHRKPAWLSQNAKASGTSAARRGGSSPFLGTSNAREVGTNGRSAMAGLLRKSRFDSAAWQECYHAPMEWLILCFALIYAFIALAPEAITQAAVAGSWVLFALFIIGEVLWISGRFLLSLL